MQALKSDFLGLISQFCHLKWANYLLDSKPASRV